MKKHITVTALALCLAMLAGCSAGTSEKAQTVPTSATTTTTAGTTAESSKDTEASAKDTDESEDDDPMSRTGNHNLPLKDREDDARAEVESAMKDYLKKTYGDKYSDFKVTVNKIYSYADEKAAGLENMDSNNLAFEVSYDLKPASDSAENIDALLVGNGEYNKESGWVEGKLGFGILQRNTEGSGPEYEIVSMATSF